MNNPFQILLAIILAIFVSACQAPVKKTSFKKAAATTTTTSDITRVCSWSEQPSEILVYATHYKCGKGATDHWSRAKESSSMLPINYGAANNTLGSVSVADSYRRGTIAVAETLFGPRAYLMNDRGTDVESRLAVRKYIQQVERGNKKAKRKEDMVQLTDEQKSAPVFDFCEPKDQWIGPFIRVKIYKYTGAKEITKLTDDERRVLLTKAQEMSHRLSGDMLAKR